MNESILNSVKKVLNLSECDTSFDQDVILHINSVLSTLVQMGIGPVNGFRITGGPDETWEDFLGSDDKRLEMVKTLVCLKVRIIFDPPTSSIVMNAYQEQIKELEWRCYIVKDIDYITGGGM